MGMDEVNALLRERPVQFVVADAGPLRWIPLDESYSFWKSDVKQRLVHATAERLYPEDHPGEYCYVGTRWVHEEQSPALVLLERHH